MIAALVAACGGNEPSDPCASVTPVVTLETPAPVFDWDSECAAAALLVTPVDSESVHLWSVVAAPGINALRSPVTYGIPPAGTAVSLPAEPLVSGREYRIWIRRAGGFIALELMGLADFIFP
jgi:hypothetical protein